MSPPAPAVAPALPPAPATLVVPAPPSVPAASVPLSFFGDVLLPPQPATTSASTNADPENALNPCPTRGLFMARIRTPRPRRRKSFSSDVRDDSRSLSARVGL
jgi:hypothetical protein